MSRTTTIRLGLLLTALLSPVAGGEATGRRADAFADAPGAMSPAVASRHHRISPTAEMRHAGVHHAGPREYGGRHWRGRRGLFNSAGYLDPWASPAGASSAHALSADGDAAQRGVDRNSFEHMPVRVGIARAPTPEPTIYRLEGRRDRPATRVIAISEPEPQGRRSRFAHAETGALLLIVPGR